MLALSLYDPAAFSSEQVFQLYLKATLLELVGDYPRMHSIIALFKELRRIDEEVEEFIAENRERLNFLENTFLKSRYFLKAFDEGDGGYLLSWPAGWWISDRFPCRRGMGEG
jgi:HEPN domain-containing protein